MEQDEYTLNNSNGLTGNWCEHNINILLTNLPIAREIVIYNGS